MAANARHENHPFLQATIVNLYILNKIGLEFNLIAHYNLKTLIALEVLFFA